MRHPDHYVACWGEFHIGEFGSCVLAFQPSLSRLQSRRVPSPLNNTAVQAPAPALREVAGGSFRELPFRRFIRRRLFVRHRHPSPFRRRRSVLP